MRNLNFSLNAIKKKPQKIITTVRKLFIKFCHSWRRFLDSVLQVALFRVSWFKWSVKKHCVAKVLLAIREIFLKYKIIVTIIPTDLVTNSFLSSFCPFLQIKNKNQVFSKLMASKEKYFCFLFVTSRALLQNHVTSFTCYSHW